MNPMRHWSLALAAGLLLALGGCGRDDDVVAVAAPPVAVAPVRAVEVRDRIEAVGQLVRHAEAEGRPVSDYVGESAAAVNPHLSSIRPEWWDVTAGLERRSVSGGSAPSAVRDPFEEARARLEG